MKQEFKGWNEVSARLNVFANNPSHRENRGYSLNTGQCASLRAIAERITKNGLVIADEVGMGKTCIAVELARSVVDSGGRVAILVPPGLGYQWQDELRKGDVDAPLILRTLSQYLSAWALEYQQQPWFQKQVVVISHAFTNWRLSENSDSWRWALLPELYALWRKRTSESKRLPRGYYDNEKLSDSRVSNAAESICNEIQENELNPAWLLMNKLSDETPWPSALQGREYGRNQKLRPCLESAVGLGLGIFDLVIIDEAHKSRGTESGLSHLLENVVLTSSSGRRFAMTATPVELDISQWKDTLSRIGLDKHFLIPVIDTYSGAVKRVRQCPSSQDAREAYKRSAVSFQTDLSPYLLRRDKREDSAVQLYAKHLEHLCLPILEYRRETEISIETATLSPSWKQAVCAAEALSVVTRRSDNGIAQRLRLTIGNGHGISALIDQIKRDEDQDKKQEEPDEPQPNNKSGRDEDIASDPKRIARTQWWLDIIAQAFSNGDDPLFDHPAILAAVQAIEEVTGQGEKVLVFGRFTLPLRALVDLLNAREMLRCLQNNQSWPQSKVHDKSSDGADQSDWPAVQAAHHQLQSVIPLEQIDQKLKAQYEQLEIQRKKLRHNLISNIEEGFRTQVIDQRTENIFAAFKESLNHTSDDENEQLPLALVSKALYELMEKNTEPLMPSNFAEAFIQLLSALSDRDEGDSDGDGKLDEKEARDIWNVLKERLETEYSRTQGSFARLMNGNTPQASRRMIQLAFNRSNSFPKVLVAQSVVGREGLNLHKACRVVVLLHPEWNPGVVEQQIGRVDRVGSYWSMELNKAIDNNPKCEELPRIEVRPVIFKGTYDEYNWKVLRERWDNLRAQLHGIVIPPALSDNDQEMRYLVAEINKSAPNFSPLKMLPDDQPAGR